MSESNDTRDGLELVLDGNSLLLGGWPLGQTIRRIADNKDNYKPSLELHRVNFRGASNEPLLIEVEQVGEGGPEA